MIFHSYVSLPEGIISNSSFISTPRRRDSPLDCCDVRGRTPLIYAAAFGSVSIAGRLSSWGTLGMDIQ